jgi:hypothetical protein
MPAAPAWCGEFAVVELQEVRADYSSGTLRLQFTPPIRPFILIWLLASRHVAAAFRISDSAR